MQQNLVSDTSRGFAEPSRRRLLKANRDRVGYISFDGQTSTVPCSVREFDEKGAVISMNGWLAVPEEFPLVIEPDRIRVVCKVTL